MADLVALVSELRSSISKIENKIGTEEKEGILEELNNKLNFLRHRLEDYNEFGELSLSRKRRIHPRLLREMDRIASKSESRSLGILIIASVFKDSMPWIYEIGLEAYRKINEGDLKSARESIDDFRKIIDYTLHSKMSHEFFMRDKSMMMFVEESFMYLEDLFHSSMKKLKNNKT